MDRPIIYSEQVPRSFDILSGWKDGVAALGNLMADVIGQNGPVVAGFAATPTGPTSLTINIGAGRVYQQSALDQTGYGSLSSDSTVILQQGAALAQQIVLTTSGLTSGKSRWALIQAQFAQGDAVRAGDPTSGILQFFNTADPATPLEGQGGNDQPLPTVRQGTATVNVIYGSVANTGSEVPPNPSAGFVGLYLVDLAFGQTTVAGNQILVAGPSVGANVPSNYPQAPFLAGLINAHHSGGAGQAPKVDLSAEVQGLLPPTNLLLPGAVPNGSQTFDANGNFTVPAGVTRVMFECWGDGGGGSGNADGVRGTAGGGGAYGLKLATGLTPGQVIAISIGPGGAGGGTGGTGNNNGAAGAGTSVALTPSFTVAGGSGGNANSGNTADGGAAPTGANLAIAGSRSTPAIVAAGNQGVGQGGAAPRGGSGGVMSAGGGTNGIAPGGGGGQGLGNGSASAGGQGAPGRVIAWW